MVGRVSRQSSELAVTEPGGADISGISRRTLDYCKCHGIEFGNFALSIHPDTG
jgi:hypothetical protein